MNVEIKLLSKTAKKPEKMSEYAAGYDVYSDQEIKLEPMQRAAISTGIAIALPKNHEAQIRPRSGMALKHGVTVLNSPGTIDSDYRGEVKVILINLSNDVFVIQNGMRIAQMIVSKYENIGFIETEVLKETERGSDGFGSTGEL